MAINFISSKDSQETRTMHTRSYNTEIMMGNELNEIIKELFKSLLQNYQKDLEISMRGSESMEKIFKYNHGEKSIKASFIIYADLGCLLKKCTHIKIILKNHQQLK